MALNIPNSIDNDTPADASEVEDNFNAIETYVNTNVMHRDGSVALTAPLTLPGDPTQPDHAANKDYVDSKVALAGDTMTGPLILPATQSTDDNSATNRTFVVDADALKLSLTGGTMTGPLYLAGPQTVNPAAAVRYDFLGANFLQLDGDTQMSGPLLLDSPQSTSAAAAIRLDYANSTYVQADGDTAMSGSLLVGGNPFTANTAGSFVGVEGTLMTQVTATAGGVASTANIYLDRTGTGTNQPAAVGGTYIDFQRHGSSIGTIKTVTGPGIAYNETSDYRLKDDLGEIEDPLDIVGRLRPKHLRWKSTGDEFDGFIAHEVQQVVPQAVDGVKDATNDDGSIDPQQFDSGKLIVYLVAAVQHLARRVAELEAGHR